MLKLIPRSQKRMLPNLHFDNVTYDCYVQYADLQQGSFLYDCVRPCPGGYPSLDRKMIRWASKYLQDLESRFTLRLFVLGHGEVVGERGNMMPIYTATYGRQRRRGRGSSMKLAPNGEEESDGDTAVSVEAQLVERTIDEDFARCVLNKGCSRCKGTARRG